MKHLIVILILISAVGHLLFCWTQNRTEISAPGNPAPAADLMPPPEAPAAKIPTEEILTLQAPVPSAPEAPLPVKENYAPAFAGMLADMAPPPSLPNLRLTRRFFNPELAPSPAKPPLIDNFLDIEAPKPRQGGPNPPSTSKFADIEGQKLPVSPHSVRKIADIEPQKPLTDPPAVIKAAYFTGWSAGHGKKVDYLLNLVKSTEVNAVVIDIKDYSGYVGYDIQVPEVEKYGARQIRIARLNTLIKRLHEQEIYVIARITVFQDPVLAKARPDLAVKSRAHATVWRDRKGLSWVDPASKEVWEYNLKIAREAAARGFDELNFDYIRFPSDGDMKDMQFPFWDGKTSKRQTLRNFFRYLRAELPGTKISADLFGLATVNKDDLGIGQVIEDAYEHFDYVCPMVYPSHYAEGFLQYENPAVHPYEVIKHSLETALRRLFYPHHNSPAAPALTPVAAVDIPAASITTPLTFPSDPATSTATPLASAAAPPAPPAITGKKYSAKLRPWLQDFNLGASYDAKMVQKEIQAVYDSGITSGWMLWSPSNNYHQGALAPKPKSDKS